MASPVPPVPAGPSAPAPSRVGSSPAAAGRVRETRTTPVMAARTPAPARASGCSPLRKAAATGTTAPQAEIGATTDMVPSARPR